jgi:hypothetical protein
MVAARLRVMGPSRNEAPKPFSLSPMLSGRVPPPPPNSLAPKAGFAIPCSSTVLMDDREVVCCRTRDANATI